MKTRQYFSPLREDQERRTKSRILDAVVCVLAKGPAELSVPAVARAAGVSVPTVYRHFGSKKALVDALYGHYSERIGTRFTADEGSSIETFIGHLPDIFRRHDRLEPALRAAMSGSVAKRKRADAMPARLAQVERAVRISAPELTKADAERLRDMFVVLTTSATQRAYKDYLGMHPDEAAERVAWTMRTLLDACRSNSHQKPKRKGRKT